jgi:hypothetical protein
MKKTLEIPLLEPHVHSEEQYEKLKPTIDRMIADGVVLFSLEKLQTPKPTKQTR